MTDCANPLKFTEDKSKPVSSSWSFEDDGDDGTVKEVVVVVVVGKVEKGEERERTCLMWDL